MSCTKNVHSQAWCLCDPSDVCRCTENIHSQVYGPVDEQNEVFRLNHDFAIQLCKENIVQAGVELSI
jgi:hypothetical protein